MSSSPELGSGTVMIESKTYLCVGSIREALGVVVVEQVGTTVRSIDDHAGIVGVVAAMTPVGGVADVGS